MLFQWRNNQRFINYCSTRRNEVTLSEFSKELDGDLKRDRHLQCLILLRDKPIGTIFAYGLNRTDGYVYVTTYIDDTQEKSGYGAEAFALFILHLFKSLELYKIYADVYSHNTHSLKCLKNAGFVEEGRFMGHRLYQNKRYDLVRLSFFRYDFQRLEQFVSRLTKNNKI